MTLPCEVGGTGKTTTTAALAQAAAYKGKRVLAIDLDPQGNLTFALGYQPSNRGCDSYNMLIGTSPAEELVDKTRQGIDIIGASWNLQTISSTRGSARRLQNAIGPLKKKYDVIIIDTSLR